MSETIIQSFPLEALRLLFKAPVKGTQHHWEDEDPIKICFMPPFPSMFLVGCHEFQPRLKRSMAAGGSAMRKGTKSPRTKVVNYSQQGQKSQSRIWIVGSFIKICDSLGVTSSQTKPPAEKLETSLISEQDPILIYLCGFSIQRSRSMTVG